MRTCADCGRKLGFFSRGPRCRECAAKARQAEQLRAAERTRQLAQTAQAVIAAEQVNAGQRELLESLSKREAVEFYNRLYAAWEADNELSEAQIVALAEVQEICGLSHEEVDFNARVRPYQYALMIRDKQTLPVVRLNIDDGSQVVLKRNEIIHFADTGGAVLKETRTVNLGYRGGSHGISIPVPGLKGVRYRVGAHRGQLMKEERLVETSRGFVLVTSQRLLLHPAPGNKPLSIPLNKVLAYHCYGNGVEVFREGRERGYFLQMQDSGSVELVGLCLGFLLSQRD